MQTPLAPDGGPAVQIPLMVVAEVQDSLLVVMHDLQRLQGLLSHACDNLMDRFGEANTHLAPIQTQADGVPGALDSLRAAITELQFQDMASQLIVHTTRVLQGCAFRLAAESMGQEEGEEASPFTDIQPERPNPVTQSEMDAGSIELF
ncbi:hypothetical protein GT347_07965 [Xylophilus rhododendri]|uniref:Uncharacterized protein n=1 Tax=Xylophilus rhododendri TaxID=2697032 RepID=A0A857J3W8_9BURK|nr:hypothetical protein [Xylophilus rhododendri]QHI97933.1 hypothetical protein GT347_07965 [Xylophilus rhododendri]